MTDHDLQNMSAEELLRLEEELREAILAEIHMEEGLLLMRHFQEKPNPAPPIDLILREYKTMRYKIQQGGLALSDPGM